jgi:hypothetical protein
MIVVGLAAVLAGVLIVVLNGDSPHSGRRAPGSSESATQLASTYLGMPPSTLRRRLRSGETLQQVAESTPGHSASGLVRLLLASRAEELRKEGLTPAEVRAQEQVLRMKLKRELRSKRRVGAVLAAASKYLGLSEAQLRAQLRAGHTLADVAAARGHSRSGLVDAILRVRRTRLAAARRAHQITPAQERRAIEILKRRIERAITTQV